VVGSQIDNLTPDLSFGYNLCVKFPNGSCKLILDIYVLRYFQWYKELLNPNDFDPYNRSLKIRESIGSPILKLRAHLGVWGFIPSHSFALSGTWNVTPMLHTWPAPSQTLALVANLRLGLRQSWWMRWTCQDTHQHDTQCKLGVSRWFWQPYNVGVWDDVHILLQNGKKSKCLKI